MKTDKTDNELINEFMDIKEVTQYFDSYGIKKPIYWARNNIFRTRTHDAPGLSIKEFINESKYQTSWDWLMPVVEKIESIRHIGIDAIYFKIEGRTCKIWTYFDVKEFLRLTGDDKNEGNKFKVGITGTTKIDATHGAIIEFIKWYNSQPKS